MNIVLFLVIIILLLSITLIGLIIFIYFYSKISSISAIFQNIVYLDDKEKKLFLFIIDMYIDYGSEIGIIPEEEHDVIIINLEKLKQKIKNEKY